MTKADIIESVYNKVGFSKKESAEIVELVFDTMKETLEKGEKIEDLRLRELHRPGEEGPDRAKPADRRGDRDQRPPGPDVSAQPGPQERPERLTLASSPRNAGGAGRGWVATESEAPGGEGAAASSPAGTSESAGVTEARAPEAPTVPGTDLPGGGLRLPDRRYFRIGEVAELVGVKAHVLRYWESEFPELRPKKSPQGQRLYRRRDVEIAAAVCRLLHGERYTIAGARERLKELLSTSQLDLFVAPKVPVTALQTGRLESLRDGLKGLLDLLDRRAEDLTATRD